VPDEEILAGGPVQVVVAAVTLSGGSYADLIWEQEQAAQAATGPATHGSGPADEYMQAINSTAGTDTGFALDQFSYREDHRNEQ
jgi:hypothetical protein